MGIEVYSEQLELVHFTGYWDGKWSYSLGLLITGLAFRAQTLYFRAYPWCRTPHITPIPQRGPIRGLSPVPLLKDSKCSRTPSSPRSS
jgi:hypothetical protein